MGIVERFRSGRRVRKAVKRVFSENDPAGVEELLKEFPNDYRRVADRARKDQDYYPMKVILLAIGIARAERFHQKEDSQSPLGAVELLRTLIDNTIHKLEIAENDEGWCNLREAALRDLWNYLIFKREYDLQGKIRRRLTTRQVIWIAPKVDEADYLDFLKSLHSNRELNYIALQKTTEHIPDFIQDVALGTRPTGLILDNALGAASILWKFNCIDIYEEAQHKQSREWAFMSYEEKQSYFDLIRLKQTNIDTLVLIVTMIAIVEPEMIRKSVLLNHIAASLPDWIAMALPDKSRLLGSTKSRVSRTARLLARFPSTDWIEFLHQAWIYMDDLVRREHQSDQFVEDSQILIAADSIAFALGICASLDKNMRYLENETSELKKHRKNLQKLINNHGSLREKHNLLIEQYNQGMPVVEQIKILKVKISESQETIDDQHRALREKETPVALLLRAVTDAQSYPKDVRQSAALGLNTIFKASVLEKTAQILVRKALYSALGKEFDETLVRNRILAVLPDNDKRVPDLLAAAEQYAATYDRDELTYTINRLAPEFQSLVEEIIAGVEKSKESSGRDEFQERVVRLLPDEMLLEFVEELRSGLRWMVELVEGQSDIDRTLEDNLIPIAVYIRKELQGMMDFMSKYPLRLMTLDRHKNILGFYSCEKVSLEYWTRYSPPSWFRGANPAEVGEVHKRYINLDDRSRPNAMGIYYRLFEHPLLALPVIYHEFLHYGGTKGDPEQGIPNEMEVKLREILYARHLMTRLAPARDEDLHKFEDILADVIERNRIIGLAHMLLVQFDDDETFDSINREIENTYGPGLDEDTAITKVKEVINKQNNQIYLLNMTDEQKRAWCPEIDWPSLNTPETQPLTDRFREILLASYMQDPRLNHEQRDHVLAEQVSRTFITEWIEYQRRRGALTRFTARFKSGQLDVKLIQCIINHFHLESVPLDLVRLIHDMFIGINPEDRES